MDHHALLAVYDDQLRTDAETPGAVSVTRHGPLRLVTFSGGRGFVTYRDIGGADAATIRRLVAEALAHFVVDPTITRVEWKTRGHDRAPGCTRPCWSAASRRTSRSRSCSVRRRRSPSTSYRPRG